MILNLAPLHHSTQSNEALVIIPPQYSLRFVNKEDSSQQLTFLRSVKQIFKEILTLIRLSLLSSRRLQRVDEKKSVLASGQTKLIEGYP